MPQVPRALGRWDLVLLKVVAIVNINNVPPVADSAIDQAFRAVNELTSSGS